MITMKHIAITFLATAAAISLVFAQGFVGNSHHAAFDSKKPPPLALPEAYALAAARIGTATNRFYCVSASWLGKPGEWSKRWTFGFSNTNGEIAKVEVFFSDYQVFIDTNSAELLK